MPIKPLACLAFLFITVVHSVYAQNQDYPGYYIDKNGDSVVCSIEYLNWYRNPGSIDVLVNNTRKTLGPEDIQRFGVTGYDEYQSANVTYHLNPIHGQDLPFQYSDETATRDCFLRVMIRGTYNLFELRFADRAYYFISERGGPMRELIIRARTANGVIVLDEQYKSVLSDLMTREHIFDQDIAHLRYTPAKLSAVVGRLNYAHSGIRTAVAIRTAPKTKSFILDVFAGGMLYGFPNQYQTKYATGKLPSAFSTEFGVGGRYIYPRNFGAWSLGLSLGYSSFSSHTAQSGAARTNVQSVSWYDTTYYSENQSISNSMLMTNFDVMYIFTHQAKLNFYFRAGANLNVLLYTGENSPKSYIGSNYKQTSYLYAVYTPAQPDGSGQGTVPLIRLARTTLCFNLSAGVLLGRNRFELTYYSPMELEGADNQPSFAMHSYGVYYYFSILK